MASDATSVDAVTALTSLTSDPSGTETFARYRWQAKQAVRLWLTCLQDRADTPIAVVCEHVEDVVVVLVGGVRFAQLKTRDRGSWTDNQLCSPDGAMKSLARSYNEAKKVGLHEVSTFEAWLEGPMSSVKTTVAFFRDPTTATKEIRAKIVAFGLPKKDLDHFLSRVRVEANQPPQAHIDATILLVMGALWPTLPNAAKLELYERLLSAAEAAQASQAPPENVRRQLQAALKAADEGPLHELGHQVLPRASIRAMTPPTAHATQQELLSRLDAGEYSSALEMKMLAGGASEESVAEAKQLRADAEVERQLLLSSRLSAEEDLERLAGTVLVLANATASKARQQAVANPLIAHEPAQFIASELLSQPANLSALDSRQLFGRDPLHIYGLLCQLSDECKFWWGRDD